MHSPQPQAQTTETKSDTPPWDAKRNKPKGAFFRKLITWTIVLGLVALIGYGLMPKPIEVELGAVSRGPLTVHVVEEGKTRIRNRYIVSAPIAGQMRRVPLKAGDEIIAGKTVITTIEPVMASLLDPRTRVQTEARIKTTEAARAQAAQSLDMAKTAEKFATTNWERTQKLKNSGSISETDRDNAERDYEMKQREVRAGEFALKVAEFELEQAKAALLQLSVPDSEKKMEYPVMASVSGRVLKVMQESAMVVTPGTAILEVGDPSDIEIEAEILSRDAVAITKGAKVQVEQWGDDQALEAIVRLVEPAAFTKVSALGVEEQRVYVLSDLVNPPEKAKALGDRYRVEVRVAVWHKDDVMLVPAGALFREGSAWKTFVYDGGKAKKVTIEAGRSDGRMTEVVKGLDVGTKVLMHPPDTVKDGVAVTERTVE
ncbi:MAG TPA: HlyD family efflux transporter periplasmic adaptor subunit [Candidatus Saccharimonadia bacterium]|nr:HlyD family efflux transporter periplasmic adaptor subunit [Candidatus Saccharimonadia bacterium]